MSSELATDEAIAFLDVWKRYRLGSGGNWGGDLRDETGQWLRRLLRRDAAATPSVDALAGVTFRVRRGENVGLIGANGAGKTTALKLLSRITVPTRGEILVRGRVASLIQVGAGFHRELTGRENVYLYGAILGLSRAELDERYGAIVEFAGLERFMDTPVKRYSSGMHVRLGFSVAVHVDADVLLVDEVLAVGDRDFRERSLERMQTLVRGETTLIFVSHQRDLVESACQRALLLDEGHVLKEGPVGEVWDAYEQRAPHRTAREAGPLELGAVEQDGGAEDGPLTITIPFAAREAVENASFAVTIRHGSTVLFATTSDTDRVAAGAHGAATVEFDRLALLPGEYHLTVEALAGRAGRHVKSDQVDLPLLVAGGTGDATGLVSLRPRWRVAAVSRKP